jgi:hypothetical protein
MVQSCGIMYTKVTPSASQWNSDHDFPCWRGNIKLILPRRRMMPFHWLSFHPVQSDGSLFHPHCTQNVHHSAEPYPTQQFVNYNILYSTLFYHLIGILTKTILFLTVEWSQHIIVLVFLFLLPWRWPHEGLNHVSCHSIKITFINPSDVLSF